MAGTETVVVRGDRILPEGEAVLVAMRKAGPGHLLPLQEFRRALEGTRAQLFYAYPEKGIKEVVNVAIPGPGGDIPLRIYVPEADGPVPVLIYFHGGGWVLGNNNSHGNLAATYAAKFQYVVISVEYRLAPEHPFPAAIDDSYAATLWAAANAGTYGGDPSRLATIGESAGGNLSGVIPLLARDKGGPSLKASVMACPPLSADLNTASYAEFGDCSFSGRGTIEFFLDQYLPKPEDRVNPKFALALAPDHSGLPPTLILTGECDALRDEGEAYADLLKSRGVEARSVRFARHFHNSMTFNKLFGSQVDGTFEEIGNFLKAAFEGAGAGGGR